MERGLKVLDLTGSEAICIEKCEKEEKQMLVKDYIDRNELNLVVLIGTRTTWTFADNDAIPYYMGDWKVTQQVDGKGKALILYVHETDREEF